MVKFPFSSRFYNLGQTQYVSSPIVTVEKEFVKPTGNYKVEYSYVSGLTEKREFDNLELDGYLKNNDYCAVIKDSIEAMFKRHKEGKDFIVESITQI